VKSKQKKKLSCAGNVKSSIKINLKKSSESMAKTHPQEKKNVLFGIGKKTIPNFSNGTTRKNKEEEINSTYRGRLLGAEDTMKTRVHGEIEEY
jgi:hypothetical protein